MILWVVSGLAIAAVVAWTALNVRGRQRAARTTATPRSVYPTASPPDVQPILVPAPEPARRRHVIRTEVQTADALGKGGQGRILDLPDVQPIPVPAREPAARRRHLIRTEVQTGDALGKGGQGRILDVPDDPSLVFKAFSTPIRGGVSLFSDLLDARESVVSDLAGQPISLCWPESPVVKGADLVGYVMPKIGTDFYFAIQVGPGRKKRLLRELQYAVPKQSAFQMPFTVTGVEATALVRLVGRFLDAMHHRGMVYGDLSWSNFTFALAPLRLCVHDFDSTRELGSPSFTGELPFNTVDWNDPEAPAASVSSLDTERYKFALLVFRMLVVKDRHSRLDPNLIQHSTAPLRKEDIAHLCRRAAGPSGTRPHVEEWLNVLTQAESDVSEVP
jgi:hypothetical protein